MILPRPKSATKKRPQANNQDVSTVPAPVGGLNVRDPISNMPPTDAYDLSNWIPQQYGLKMRKGYSEWGSHVAATETKSIMPYFPSAVSITSAPSFITGPTTMPGKLFCVDDAGIYDITSSGPIGAAVQALSGTDEAGRMSHANFSNAAGSWLVCCSETDGYFTYDGTTWVKVAMGVGPTEVSVGDPTKFVQCCLWKRRIWFVERNSSKVWYLAADALYGVAAALDLGPLLKKGGGIAWIANWTIDAGEGIDDFLVICSENGEIIIYKGTDPASATTFAQVGRWDVGLIPKGRKGFCQIGGDLLVLSTLGIAPISYITRGGAQILAASQKDYTSKITRLFTRDLSQTYNEYGWSMTISGREGVLIVTVPDSQVSASRQYAMNVESGAWTKFDNMDMRCLQEMAGWMFFGDSIGTVWLAFYGYTDKQLLNGYVGDAIVGVLQPAFSPFGQSAQLKQFKMAHISFLATVTPGLAVNMNVDFTSYYPNSSPVLPSSPAAALWDSGIWDESVWGGDPVPVAIWTVTPGIGYYGSLTVLTTSIGELIFTEIAYLVERGGVLG